ncbi:MAG: M20 family metallopeptidase [Planctomycetota bacterium]|jgi:acetylornithine deacetylase
MSLDLVETLGHLVAIPSVNPMGSGASGKEYGEARLTDYLESFFDRLGMPHQRQPVHPGRANLTGRMDGEIPLERGGKLILFGAHQDTVPVGGMTIEPWKPEVRDGRLYGRGACDVKGGMAAMLTAIARLAHQRPPGMPTILMVCTVNEEYGFSGAAALAESFNTGDLDIIPRKPDAAVIAEPTDLDVVVAHKGVIRWRCHTRGRAGHSARPNADDNAIYRMGRLLVQLEQYQRGGVGRLCSHSLCGPATMSVGTVRGGVSVNTVPSRCTIEIDRRTPPGEDLESARRHLVEHLATNAPADTSAEHDPPFMQGPALSDESNGPLADQLARIARDVAGDCRKTGVPYATDAAFLAAAGIPTVVFGPGSIEQAHTDDEWISLDQLEQATEVFHRFARLGVD